MGCAKWRRRFQAFWMSADEKPKGRDKQLIEKQNRQEAKREIKEELEYNLVDDLDIEHQMNQEIEEVMREADKVFDEYEGEE